MSYLFMVVIGAVGGWIAGQAVKSASIEWRWMFPPARAGSVVDRICGPNGRLSWWISG